MSKIDFKHAAKIYGLTIFSLVMCFFIYMSITFIFTAVGTHVIGYTTYEVQENGETAAVSSYEFKEGEEKTVPKSTETQTFVSDYSKMSSGAVVFENIVSQAFMAVVFMILIYYNIGTIGKRDGDDFRYNKKPIDMNRGLKIGLVAAIPSFIFYLVLVVSKFVSYNIFGIYKIINITFMPIINLICGGKTDINDISLPAIFALIVIVLILPVICAVSYRIGYNDEAILNKILYKQKKK